jgi:hypothetical protein
MEATLSDRSTRSVLTDLVLDSALSGAAGAVAVSGNELTAAVLELPDAVLGQAFKERLQKMSGALSQHATPAASASGADLVRKVELPPIHAFEGNDNSLDRARLHAQAQVAQRRMVTKGELLDTSAMTEALGMSRQALNKAVRERRILSVEVDATPYYPAFYAARDLDRKVLEKVTRKLADLPGWTKLDFFTSANGALGGLSPLDALRQGLVSPAVELAEAYASE